MVIREESECLIDSSQAGWGRYIFFREAVVRKELMIDGLKAYFEVMCKTLHIACYVNHRCFQ